MEQILDVPVQVPKIMPQDRTLQRTVKQAETSGADGQTHSLFQESSSVALQTSTVRNGDIGQMTRRALDLLVSPISVIMKFGAGADGDPFVTVKDLITTVMKKC